MEAAHVRWTQLDDTSGNLTEIFRKDAVGATKLRTCFTRPLSGQNAGLVTELLESTTLTDCTGNKTKFEYDVYGNQSAVVDPRFSAQPTPPKTVMAYDLRGRRLTVTNELTHATTFTYDNKNNVLTVKDHLNNTTTNTYDAKGNLRTVTDANSKVTTYNYDNGDRLVSVVDANGKATAYGYDANGNRTSVTNANRQQVGLAPESGAQCGTAGTGNDIDEDGDGKKDDGCPSVLYTYDNLDRLSSQKDGLGNTWSYGYDAASRLATRLDAKGQQTAYGYNNRNDLTLIDYPAGTDTTFQYDNARNRTQMVDTTGTTTYTPDALDRLSSVTFPGARTVSYGYNNVGNRTTITYPGGSNQVTYGYDVANNLTSVTDWNNQQTTYAYDNAGNLTTVTLPSGTGVVGTYGYDNADRLTSISWAKGGNTLASATYTLDNVGNRSQRVDQLGTHTYGNDNLHRLTSASYPGPSSDGYTYDANGNRLTKNATTYTYDAADRLTATGGVSYGYDNNGNLTTRGSDTFVWDSEDRMTSATVGGATLGFTYNGDGLRNSRALGANTTTFTWDVEASIPQILDDGTFRYVHGLQRLAEVGPGTTTHYYLSDVLGSVMALTDASGVVVNTYNYDVFGAVRSSIGTQPNEFKFAGEQEDTWPSTPPSVQRLAVDTIVSVTNLSGATVASLDDDPDAPDADWATATSVADTDLRVGFPTPPSSLQVGSGLQEFRVLLRKNAAGGNNPTYDLELWETGGGSRLALLVGGATLSSETGAVVAATWNANLLGTADGSKVEIRVLGHRSSGSPSARRTVEIGAVEWNSAVNGTTGGVLYYLRARYYDPATGRFLAQDPHRGTVGLPSSQNRYPYVRNNPALLIDPSGRQVCSQTEYEDSSEGVCLRTQKPRFWRFGKVRVSKELSGTGHAAERHAYESSYPGRSKFLKGEDITSLVNQAQITKPIKLNGGRYARVMRLDRDVGTLQNGSTRTRIYSVIHEADGTVVTAHPGLPAEIDNQITRILRQFFGVH